MALVSTDRWENTPEPQEMEENYCTRILKKLNNIRREKILCDVTLHINGEEFCAHSGILAASSPYFYSLLTTENIENCEVTLDECQAHVMDNILEYMYLGDIDMNEDNSQAIVLAADFLQLIDLKEAGCEFLQHTLDKDNCLNIYSLATELQNHELGRKSLEIICLNFQILYKTERFLQLKTEQLCGILTADHLTVDSEEEIFHAMLGWVKYEQNTRKECLSKLFSCLRLASMSKFFLIDIIGCEELIRNDLKCMQMLYDTLAFLTLPDRYQHALPRPRRVSEKCYDVIACLGGFHWDPDSVTGCTYCYVPELNQSVSLSPMLTPRRDHAAAVCQGYLYTVGGKRSGMALDTVEKYDPPTNSWYPVPSMQYTRSLLGVAELGGYLYVVGGWNKEAVLKSVERYSPKDNKWTFVAPLHIERTGACVVALKDNIFAIGGKTQVGELLNTAEKYSPDKNEWEEVTPMNERRVGAMGVALQERILVVGGSNDPLQTVLQSCEIFDPKVQEWIVVCDTQVPRLLAGIARIGARVYLLGGQNTDNVYSSVECYNEEKNEWQLVGELPQEVSRLQCCSLRLPDDFIKMLPDVVPTISDISGTEDEFTD